MRSSKQKIKHRQTTANSNKPLQPLLHSCSRKPALICYLFLFSFIYFLYVLCIYASFYFLLHIMPFFLGFSIILSYLWDFIRLSRCGHLRKSELQNTTRASAAFHYTEPPDTASIACATAGQGTVVDRGMHTHTQYTHNLSRWACMDTKQRWSYNMGAVPTPLACPRITRRGGVTMYVYAARSVGSAPQVAAPPPCGGGVHLAMQG